MEKNIPFLAVGDITIDAFIRIEDAEATCDINKEHCKLCVRFGDKIPYEFDAIIPAVGNAANAAVSVSRLGIQSALVAGLGNDTRGKECLAVLEKEHVTTSYITQDGKYPTNYHYVLWYGPERTILVKHAPFLYSFPSDAKIEYIYLTSLGKHADTIYKDISAYLDTHPETKLVFQPGTFQLKQGFDGFGGIGKKSYIYIVNKEEAEIATGSPSNTPIKTLLETIHAAGPKIVCITDGPRGAYASDGTHAYFMPAYPDPKPPYERTGAGDAFASTFTAALIHGKTLEEALQWGPINSMSVVQCIGAQEGLLTKDALEGYLQKAPETYKVQPI